MKAAEIRRRVAREAKRQIEQQGFTRKRIEQHIRKILRPRPRWVPRPLWLALAAILIRGTGELEAAELDQAERDLLEAYLERRFVDLAPLERRVRALRARQPQSAAQ